jgi:hypothetical protein
MALTAGPELGVEVLGPAETEYFFEKTDMAREENEAFSISGKKAGQRGSGAGGQFVPMNSR